MLVVARLKTVHNNQDDKGSYERGGLNARSQGELNGHSKASKTMFVFYLSGSLSGL